jgi:hypothetical protein
VDHVRQDTSFLPVPGGHSAVRARFVVRAADPTTVVSTDFTVSANGSPSSFPVKIIPANLAIAFSNPAPALGDTVTLTAPANCQVLRRAPPSRSGWSHGDHGGYYRALGRQLHDLLPAAAGYQCGDCAVTGVVVTYLPGQTFTLNTTGALTTPTSPTSSPLSALHAETWAIPWS